MAMQTLRKVEEVTLQSGGAITTTPIRKHIQEEIDAGNLKASAARSGPLGIYTGEMFLTLTDAGREKLQSGRGDADVFLNVAKQ